MRNFFKELPGPGKLSKDPSKGVVWPLVIFSIILLFNTLYSTFNGLPFAFISFIGSWTIRGAISQSVYTNEKLTVSKRIIYSIPFWIVGAVLIRLGGMNSLTIGSINLNLYLISSLIGATYYPPNMPNFSEELPNNGITAGKLMADNAKSNFPRRPTYEQAIEYAENFIGMKLLIFGIRGKPGFDIVEGPNIEDIKVKGNFENLNKLFELKILRENPLLKALDDEESAVAYFIAWKLIREFLWDKGIELKDGPQSSQEIADQMIT